MYITDLAVSEVVYSISQPLWDGETRSECQIIEG
jgi:hypothetical protein